MNTADDDPPSGLNTRLRPRKSHVPSPPFQKVIRKPEGKSWQEKPKRTITPSRAPPNKQDDLVNKSDFSPPPQFLCPFCNKRFASKQTVSKHAVRIHLSASKQDSFISCLFCKHSEASSNAIIRHMVDNHPNQYFACVDCHTRFSSTSELVDHKLNGCDKLKVSYRNKLRQNLPPSVKKSKKEPNANEKEDFHAERKEYQHGDDFNGIVISCELKPSQVHNEGDIEDNITTNLILPPSKSLGTSAVLDKNAVIVLDDIQWNKRIPSNFSFHNTDADQILSRLGVVHRSPRTGEPTRKDWFKTIDDSTQKFERCFDTIFYSKVASNVQENLSKFLDGSFNFNPDPDATIKTRKSNNSVAINTAEGFPILLACQQYSRNLFEGYMPRAIAPKHKWKWDSLESDKRPISPNQVKRDAHTNNCIITLVSGLDIWTQLCMRRKFEDKFSSAPLEKKTEKQNVIGKELKEILESRDIPTVSPQVVKYKNKPAPSGEGLDFPASLGLSPASTSCDLKPAVLSGEWVRPRCYVCCACGDQTRDSRTLAAHISTQHPNAQVQHYEVVGEPLLNADILKHLYVPPSQIHNRTRPMRGFRDCTKCNKSITLEDLHQHMLDCAGDTPTVRRRQCRYRPFGMRKRRPRLPDNTVRKKMRKDIRTRQRRQKSHIRPRQKIRTEVGDAETIRKMLADLPAKRHRVMVNPMNEMSRPRRILNKQRNKIILKKRLPEDKKNRETCLRKGKSSTAQNKSGADDPKDHLSTKDDDEDNKPLKPRVLRVPSVTNTRRGQAMKRKVVINRVKRKSIRVKQQSQSTEAADKPAESSSSASVASDTLSIDNTPNRVDVKGAAYNTREHANRGGSNNRQEQRAGRSEPAGSANNCQAPTQNVPLKHSIARLTADSETHDKSVQFHHLFLVQQECNNTNQHLPSGQQTLFENEAAVIRLDKPPLNCIQRGPIDLDVLQKNKQNKPRKGLNDCIAMLKNKLSDPAPPSTASHVSVMCGSDEPIEYEPRITIPNPTNQEIEINYNAKPVMIPPCKITEPRSQEFHGDNYMINQKYSICDSGQVTQFNPPFDDSITKRQTSKQKQNVRGKRKAVRGKSLSELEPILAQNKAFEIPPELVIVPYKPTEYRTAAAPQRSSRARSRRGRQQQSMINAELALIKSGSNTVYNQKNSTETVKGASVPSLLDLIWQNRIEVLPLNNRQISYEFPTTKSYAQKSLEVNTTMSSQIVQKQFQVSPTKNNGSGQRQIEVLPSRSNLAEQQPEILPTKRVSVSGQKPHDGHSIENSITSQNTPEVYVQSHIKNQTPPGNIDIENIGPPQEQRDICSEYDLSRELPVVLSTESHLGERVDNIHSAHASMQIESIPLDLSSKVTSIDQSNNLIEPPTCEECNYLSYETLDLSNKNFDNSHNHMNLVNDDEGAVDLSVRPQQADYRPSSEDIYIDDEVDAGPTDLSLRGKHYNVSIDWSDQRDEDMNYIQDLSYSNRTNSLEQGHKHLSQSEDYNNKSPTDLSDNNKELVRNTVQFALDVHNIAPREVADSELINYDYPTDFSVDKGKNNEIPTQSEKLQLHSEQTLYRTKEHQPSQIIYPNSVQSIVYDRYAEIPTPSYTSSLMVPHYKMRTTTATTTTTTIQTITSRIPVTADISTVSSDISSVASMDITSESNNYVYSETQAILPDEPSSYCFKPPTHTVTGTISQANNIKNRVITSDDAQFESTTPIYTLPSAISVTKIEPTNSARLTNPLLRFSTSTDTKSTEPFARAAENHEIKKIHIAPITSSHSETPDNKININSKVYGEQRKDQTKISVTDQDPETARKIAMLPKELVEILGTMPPDHRNQLLNVLPQYVSTTTATSVSKSETTQTFTNALGSKSVSSLAISGKQVSVDNNAVTPQHNIGASHIIPSVSTAHHSLHMCRPPSQVIGQLDYKKKHLLQFGTVSHHETLCVKSSEDIIMPIRYPQNSKEESIIVESDKSLIDPFTGIITKITPQVIDLTSEENSPLSSDVAQGMPSQEMAGFIVLNKPMRQKGINDQTASLRAVRIKAPSERHKDNQLLKRASIEQTTTLSKITESEDVEVDKSLEYNKCSTVQQAVITIAHHDNKNVTTDHKFPHEIVTNKVTVNPEKTDTKSRTMSISVDEIINNKNDSPKVIGTDKFITKPLLVASLFANDAGHVKNSDDLSNIGTFNDNVQNSTVTIIQSPIVHMENLSTSKDNNYQNGRDVSELNIPMISTNSNQIQETNKDDEKKDDNDIEKSDDDSEDNLSLAVMVKKKQQTSQNVVPDNNDLTKKLRNKKSKDKKKREKNPKDTTKNISSVRNYCKINSDAVLEKCSTEEVSVESYRNNNNKELIAEPETREIKSCKGSDKKANKHSKKRIKKRTELIKTYQASNNGNFNLKKDNSETTDSAKIKNDDAETSKTNVQDKLVSLGILNKTDKLSEDVLKISGTSPTPQTEVHENTIICADETNHLSNNNTIDTPKVETHETKTFEIKDNQEPISIQQDLNKNSTDKSSPTYPLSLTTPEENIILEKTLHLCSEFEKNSDLTHTKNSQDIGNLETNIPSDQPLSNSHESLTSLRRSRRGRSLFIESNNSYPVSIVANEICVEQKPPLTKKQLIFSKLLLDEEAHAENKDCIPVKETLPVIVNYYPCNTDQASLNATAPVIVTSDHDSNNKSVKSKRKSTKRKKSQQLKRKSKKTKLTNTSTTTSTMEEVGNTTVDNYLVTHTANIEGKDMEHEYLADDNDDESHNIVADIGRKNDTVSETGCTSKLNPDKLQVSPDKRKISVPEDGIQGSKAKKSKLSTDNKTNTPEAVEDMKVEEDTEVKQKCKINVGSEIRPTTCYNMPIAARRMRSKSVVVKSVGAVVYDPYDIDLDDMIEKTEPFRKKGIAKAKNTINKLKASKRTGKNSHDNMATEFDIHGRLNKMGVMSYISKPSKKNIRKTKIEISIDEDDSKPLKNKSTKRGLTSKQFTTNTNKTRTSTSYDSHIHFGDSVTCKDLDRTDKDQISDSDESSKSDMPLKKYVEEKEKKKAKLDLSFELDDTDLKQGTKTPGEKPLNDECKKNRRTLAICNNDDETEERLRSEQFMESFGFFSERKPRKSNLLASKKISETFHIIANESDDLYFGFKERPSKRALHIENRKSVDGERNVQHTPNKKTKRGRKKKKCTLPTPCYCRLCKKGFHRSDNYLRHQMTLLHISKLSEIKMKIKTVPVIEEPNYLVAFRKQMERRKILKDNKAKEKNRKKRSKIKLPTIKEILEEVYKTVREEQLSRGLSTDEELFIDCCELLQESHKNDVPNKDAAVHVGNENNLLSEQQSVSGLNILEKTSGDEKSDSKSDGDVDSITAKNILESEEVRNLENDLISGLKEAANAAANAAAIAADNAAANVAANGSTCNANNINYNRTVNTEMTPSEEYTDHFSSPNATYSHYDQIEDIDVTEESNISKAKKHLPAIKDKMYPDVEKIDIFEDKFDKIKRKCRSQAAAAKQTQAVVEANVGHKGRKKLVKKKGKKISKINYQSTVLTKGALKGFDGIKVSIPTSEIDIIAKASSSDNSTKKKKKARSKKKKDKYNSESSNKYDSDNRAKDNSSTQNKVDVYEFMDNEDAELFEFRPSTLMERFKSITSKETQAQESAKTNAVADEVDNSSASASDGDDFVYMSDDYVCSDGETENSLLSCELGNVKLDNKKVSSLKRKDVIEKNAVMGKIFKHNAVRSEKKITKSKESEKPKANLDQLFDSLLEDEHNTSVLNDECPPKKDEDEYCSSKIDLSPSKYAPLSLKPYDRTVSKLTRPPSSESFDNSLPSTSKKYNSTLACPSSPECFDNSLPSTSKKYNSTLAHPSSPECFNNSLQSTSKKYNSTTSSKLISPAGMYEPSTSKAYDNAYLIDYGPSTSKKSGTMSTVVYDLNTFKKHGKTSPKIHGMTSKKYDDTLEKISDSLPLQDDSLLLNSKGKSAKAKPPMKKVQEPHDLNTELDQLLISDDSGVARQRARRKCAVGKQNVLAETWSSESEPDGMPPRPNSAESVAPPTSRKKKGKKKEGPHSGGRRANKHVSIKKQDVESRVNSSNRHSSINGAGSNAIEGGAEGSKGHGKAGGDAAQMWPPAVGATPRDRSADYYWSDGDGEHEHVQQHGWIVGDSHKKLVTMLAHAKGRKRNSDDKRHLVE